MLSLVGYMIPWVFPCRNSSCDIMSLTVKYILVWIRKSYVFGFNLSGSTIEIRIAIF